VKKRIFPVTVVIALVLSVLAIGCPPVQVDPVVPVPVPPIKIEWVMQSLYPAGTVGYKTFVEWTERVYTLTGGRLSITPHSADAIVPTMKAFEAVVGGALDGMNMTPAYWGGKDPAMSMSTFLPFGITESWQLDIWIHERGGLELVRELYAQHGMHLIGLYLWGPESLVSTVPIHRIEDFAGLKMRSPGGILAAICARFGASLITMPLGEVYMALETGIIDLADWGTPSGNYAVGLHEVAKYFVYPFAHVNPIICIAVRPEAWNALPADIQAILETSVRELFWEKVSELWLEDKVAVEAMLAAGNVAIAWDEAEIARMAAIARETWEEWMGRSPMAARIGGSKIEFMKELGILE
jgi:TRAP-type mannitol/chloroaromatic compound transport system substrate-binding protein